MVDFAKTYNVDHDVCGKVVVATDEKELHNESNFGIGTGNKIEGIEKITVEQVREIEPHVNPLVVYGYRTGIIDFVGATKKMAELAQSINENSKVFMGHEIKNIVKEDSFQFYIQLKEHLKPNTYFCAGLQADRLAKKDGVNLKEKVCFRGDYYELTDQAKHKVKNLIYPFRILTFHF